MSNSKPIAIIPSRLESIRFPGKSLMKICGKPMIKHVVDKCYESNAFSDVYVATDSNLIGEYLKENNIKYIKTGICQTGTDRVYQASKQLDNDLIVNVQGDEPILPVEIMQEISEKLLESKGESQIIWTSYSECNLKDATDENVVKVVSRQDNTALMFSRQPLPGSLKRSKNTYFKQIGIYGYSKNTLKLFSELKNSVLEDIDRVELMRWLDYGKTVCLIYSNKTSYSVDTIEDLIQVEYIIKATTNNI